jgi:hypothetical protein
MITVEKNMLINSINEMDSIVKSNLNMEWDNWTVIIYTDDDGFFTKKGVFKDGKWKTKYTFDMVDYGVWNIPDRFITHVQV